jgi:hypothetical protein
MGRRSTAERMRPTAYVAAPVSNSPGRRVLLSTGRGDTRLTAGEAAAMARDLLAAAAGVGESAEVPEIVLGLADRVAAQSELLAACARGRG